MADEKLTTRPFKRRVLEIIKSKDLDRALAELTRLPPSRVVNGLFPLLCREDPEVRWRAVTAMGAVTAQLAQQDMEAARVIMRRLMWSLTEESGGIGWGAPEAMGEIMASHEGLAKEFVDILVSYVVPEGNFLEHEMLLRGVIWGIGRLAQARPQLVKKAAPFIRPYLESGDASLRGLAAWVLGLLPDEKARKGLNNLLVDHTEVELFLNRTLVTFRISDLAKLALAPLPG